MVDDKEMVAAAAAAEIAAQGRRKWKVFFSCNFYYQLRFNICRIREVLPVCVRINLFLAYVTPFASFFLPIFVSSRNVIDVVGAVNSSTASSLTKIESAHADAEASRFMTAFLFLPNWQFLCSR
jgi:hypothetical protein